MNLLNFKSLLFLLSFLGCCAGQGVLPHGPVDAKLGTNVTLKTLLDKPNYDYLVWNYNKNGEQVNVATQRTGGFTAGPGYEGRVSVNKTNGYLTLTSLTSDDSGDYSINVLSPAGTKTGEMQLRVLEPVSAVAIKSNIPDVIEHNSSVILTCSAKGSFLKFSWTNGTKPIVPDGIRISQKETELSSELTIRDVLRSDLVGPIYCTAQNNLEAEKSPPFNLTVYYGPDAVTITPPNPPKFIESHSNFSLTCSALSSPAATFTWYHSQQLIEVEGPVLTLKVIQNHKLGSKAEDYTCRAKNEKTQRTIQSPAVSFSVMEAISGTTITGPTGTLIAGNSTANISCQATAGKVENRKWLKDGKDLSARSGLVFSADKSSMMIETLQKGDNGVYTCELTNPISKDEASYKMVVNYGPESVKVEGVALVEVEKEVTLECKAASVPAASFTWKFNGTMTPVKAAKYVIEKAAIKDSGTYTCEAHNPVTGKTITFNHTLSVKEEIPDTLPPGAIAGIVIGVLAALGIAIGLIIYCRQKVPVESPY